MSLIKNSRNNQLSPAHGIKAIQESLETIIAGINENKSILWKYFQYTENIQAKQLNSVYTIA